MQELLQGRTQVVTSPPSEKEDSHAKGSYDTRRKAPMALYIYGLGVPLFLTKDGTGDHKKWTFWLIRSLLFVGAYLFILVLPHTKWRDRLPARPTFYRYVVILFVLNVLSAFGHALICVGADFGYCLHGLSTFFYNGFYPPLLYATFLLDYFLEDDVHLDDIYYSEMKDAGYFDTWD
ncbi:hypothetical protein L7F22_032230 [Adiantum nelumboides]|nr:hypothetical protein [Adiantum nelumboides]